MQAAVLHKNLLGADAESPLTGERHPKARQIDERRFGPGRPGLRANFTHLACSRRESGPGACKRVSRLSLAETVLAANGVLARPETAIAKATSMIVT